MSLQPFVKWAGGKRQLIDELLALKPKHFNTYFEPFVGGGALFLELCPKKACINDFNSDLIAVYKCLRNKKYFKSMIELIKEYENNHSEDYYYKIRSMDRNKNFRSLPIFVKAARCLYLNKACFNGLFRVNSKGYFNVPSAKREVVKVIDEDKILLLHKYFYKYKPRILNKDFELAVKTAKGGDFVYFDPPYDIVGDQSFTSYTVNGFGKDEQVRLRDVIKSLTEKKVFVMASNSNTPFIQDIYKDFNIHIVKAKRNINSKGDARGEVEEVIITNY